MDTGGVCRILSFAQDDNVMLMVSCFAVRFFAGFSMTVFALVTFLFAGVTEKLAGFYFWSLVVLDGFVTYINVYHI